MISAYQCDLVIWSGKTAENPAIRKIFEDHMPVPPEALISMNNYRISTNDFPLTGLDGKLSDSKLATAIGAALYSTLKLGGTRNLGIAINANTQNSRFFWGTANAKGIFQPLFTTDSQHSLQTLNYNGVQRLVIYRASSNSVMACPIPAYEFRYKPGRNIDHVNVQIELLQIDGRLDFKPCGGTYCLDGVEKSFFAAAKDDFELHIRMTDEDEIWIDSGKII